jgi:predicted O-methyltransferase YrrM
VDAPLRGFLDDLYQSGQRNDAGTSARTEKMLNITPETGELLRMLVLSGRHERVLELGTSNGYSTLWLASASRTLSGQVITLEHNPRKREMALDNIRRAGLDGWIDSRLTDIGQALPELHDFDLVFLDSERVDYPGWWPDLQHSVRPGGLMVVDNATSHVQEMAPFAAAVEQTPGFTNVLLPIGNGELLILREP